MEPFHDFHIKVERFSRITYARLYMPKIIKEYAARYIYLDADTMCIAPLDRLWATDLQGKPMGAVSERESAVDYRAGFLHLKNGKYFNDGVMLVDIPTWEQEHITEQAFSYQCEPRERFLGQSQDVLNLVFDGTNYFCQPITMCTMAAAMIRATASSFTGRGAANRGRWYCQTLMRSGASTMHCLHGKQSRTSFR